MKLVRFVIAVVFVGGLLWQCAQDSVFLSNQNAVQVGFVSIYTNKDTTLNEFTAYGLNRTDSIIYSKSKSQVAFLPLRYDQDSTAFIIQNYANIDTVIFTHSKEPYYVSADDGLTFNFQIKKVGFTENFINKVSIVYTGVNYNENSQNVKIYIR